MTDPSTQAAPSAPTAEATSSASSAGSGSPSATAETAGAAGTGQPLDMAALIGEEFAKDPTFKDFKDPRQLAKAYKDTKALVGQPRYDIPADDAPDTVRKDFYTKLGVPDAPDGYGLAAPEGYPEHMGEYMKETLGEFAKIAHENNITPKQAKAIQTWFDNHAIELSTSALKTNAAAAEAEIAAANSQLTEIFTKQFGDKTGEAVAHVKAVLETVFPDVAQRQGLEKTMSNEALLAIAAVEKHYRTTYGLADQTIGDSAGTSTKSLADMRKDAQDLMATEAYTNAMHPEHNATKEKAQKMYQQWANLTEAGKRK